MLSSPTSSSRHPQPQAARWWPNLKRWMCHPMIGGIVGVVIGLGIGAIIIGLFVPLILEWLIGTVPFIEPTPLNAFYASILTVMLVCPFTIGYAFLLLAVGYVYGWIGFVPLYLSSILGSWFWFIISRHLSRRYHFNHRMTARLFSWFPFLREYQHQLDAVSSTFASEGLKVCCLLQLSFMPYGILNTLLSLQPHVKFAPDFVLSTFISRLKILNYIWIAVSFKEIELVMDGKKRQFGIYDLIMVSRSILFTFLSFILLAISARRELAQIRARQNDQSITDTSTSSSLEESDDSEIGPSNEFGPAAVELSLMHPPIDEPSMIDQSTSIASPSSSTALSGSHLGPTSYHRLTQTDELLPYPIVNHPPSLSLSSHLTSGETTPHAYEPD